MKKNGKTFLLADTHNDTKRLEDCLRKVPADSTIYLLGDIVGGRGPLASEIVAIYYDFLRAKTPEEKTFHWDEMCQIIWRYHEIIDVGELKYVWEESIHSGTFLQYLWQGYPKMGEIFEKEMLDSLKESDRILAETLERGVDVLFITGNGEGAGIGDFDIRRGVNTEVLKPKREQFLSRNPLSAVELLDGIVYNNGYALIGVGGYDTPIPLKTKVVFAHYPALREKECEELNFNKKDKTLSRKLYKTVSAIGDDVTVVCGHVHGANYADEVNAPTRIVTSGKLTNIILGKGSLTLLDNIL